MIDKFEVKAELFIGRGKGGYLVRFGVIKGNGYFFTHKSAI
jgi:hypothetical protein